MHAHLHHGLSRDATHAVLHLTVLHMAMEMELQVTVLFCKACVRALLRLQLTASPTQSGTLGRPIAEARRGCICIQTGLRPSSLLLGWFWSLGSMPQSATATAPWGTVALVAAAAGLGFGCAYLLSSSRDRSAHQQLEAAQASLSWFKPSRGEHAIATCSLACASLQVHSGPLACRYGWWQGL